MQTGRPGLVIVKEKHCRFSLACILHRLNSSDVHSFLSPILPLLTFIIWEINARFSMQNGGLCMTHSTTISNWNPYYLTILQLLQNFTATEDFFLNSTSKNPHSLCQTPFKKTSKCIYRILKNSTLCIALQSDLIVICNAIRWF